MPHSRDPVRDTTAPAEEWAAGMPADGDEAGVARQLPVFAVIGALSTAAHLGLYAALRQVLEAQLANLVALLVTTVANTAANRRFTFRVRGTARAARHQLQGLVAFCAALALSSAALALAQRALPHTPQVEVSALIAANAAATVLRYALLRLWVFR